MQKELEPTSDCVGPDPACSYPHGSMGSNIIYRCMGLFIVAVLPTIFWLGCVFLVGYIFDLHLDEYMLCAAGLSMAVFLAMVYSLFFKGVSKW